MKEAIQSIKGKRATHIYNVPAEGSMEEKSFLLNQMNKSPENLILPTTLESAWHKRFSGKRNIKRPLNTSASMNSVFDLQASYFKKDVRKNFFRRTPF